MRYANAAGCYPVKKEHKSNVMSVTYSPDGKQLASGSSDNMVGIWDTQMLQPVPQLKGHSGWIYSYIQSRREAASLWK
jgi:WD40 repeat protein